MILLNLNKMKTFLKYLTIWISQNLAIPFWTIGHIHLMTSVYEDIIEIIASCGMNLIVAIGFFIEYFENHRNNLFKNK